MSGYEKGTNKPPRRSRSPVVDECLLDVLNERELNRACTTLEKYDDVKLLKAAALTLLEEKICEKNRKDLQTVELRAINRDLMNEKELAHSFLAIVQVPQSVRSKIEGLESRYLLTCAESVKSMRLKINNEVREDWQKMSADLKAVLDAKFKKLEADEAVEDEPLQQEDYHVKLNARFIRWMWILKYSLDPAMFDLRQKLSTLQERYIFCVNIAELFIKTSVPAHLPTMLVPQPLKLDKIIEILKNSYGCTDTSIDAVQLLYSLR